MLKKINITHSSSITKLSVLAILAVPTILTISMHGSVLAAGEPGYQLTVNVPSYPSGISTLGISITTANGYTDHANVATSGGTSWTFKIAANQGSWIRVCVNSDNSSGENCNTYNTTGSDMSVSLSPSSSNSDRYYIYPGNTYYIYPGYKHDYYLHHGWDHGLGGHDYGIDRGYGGHHDSSNTGNGGNQNSGNIGNGGFGGHHDSGNTGNGGHQNSGNTGNGGHQNSGNTGNGGNQDHWLGGHQDGGNHGITQPADRLHHLSNSAPMINAESSDDD